METLEFCQRFQLVPSYIPDSLLKSDFNVTGRFARQGGRGRIAALTALL